jgi:hypothetical protein
VIVVRELPSLRHHTIVTTPTGRRYRWGSDERNPANIPTQQRSTSSMPGGFESQDGSLPRKPGVDYADLERLSTVQLVDHAGDVIAENRLERSPVTSGDQFVINPSAVGWQAHLDDDETVSMIGLDRGLGRWQGPSRARQLALLGGSRSPQGGGTVTPDATTGIPTLDTGFDESGGWSSSSRPIVEAWYDAGDGNLIGRIRADWTRGVNVQGNVATDGNWQWAAAVATDDTDSARDTTGDLQATGPGTVDLAATASRRFAYLQFLYNAAGGTDQSNLRYSVYWTNLRVIGDHGLTIQGATAATEGLLSSDLEAYILRRWAPLLNFTTGPDGTILPSAFVISHFAYPERTKASELIKAALRFELREWAIWEDRTYFSNDRGARGNRWRARIAPAKLEETGPQVDRLWGAVMIQYRDVDGSTRTVGPPGSGAGTEDASLVDPDPENPANSLGGHRIKLLQAGTLTAAGAIELGRRFLEYQKLLDTSGRAQIVGHVMDAAGVIHPYSHVRAGDLIAFDDAADTSYRRIVHVEHDHDAYTATIDLDSPPDGMAALLERLGLVEVVLGA